MSVSTYNLQMVKNQWQNHRVAAELGWNCYQCWICLSRKLTPSPVLAMGYHESAAKGTIRLTLGRHTTVADVEAMVLC